ncbi:MAG: hypothetical protein HY914_05320 [Desulfomonile tiedjei]|nr:hypothetical protein [Desulfomonile tiedjei]
MKADKTAHSIDPSCIPGDFRENYRFLSELINCEDKNICAVKTLEELARRRGVGGLANLNRRQEQIWRQFLRNLAKDDPDGLFAPVPAELEASIRIRKRSTWLPWEAEAIRKIERWRCDVQQITQQGATLPVAATGPEVVAKRTR